MTRPGRTELVIDQTRILIYVGEPSPYSVNQEIYFDFIPVETYINAGIWVFQLEPVLLITGEYQLYLPGQAVRSADTRFFAPTPELTLTVPSTAGKLITVGAIYGATMLMRIFQAEGSGRRGAAGVSQHQAGSCRARREYRGRRAGGGYEAYTGTSFFRTACHRGGGADGWNGGL